MKKLKTILLFNGSKYAHSAFVITLFLLASKHHYLIILCFIYWVYIYKKSKSLSLLTLIFMVVIGIRYYQVQHIKPKALPIQAEVIEVYQDYFIVKSRYKYIVYDENALTYKPGMIVYIEGIYLDHDSKHIEHNFNDYEYLKTKSIIGRILPSDIVHIKDKWSVYVIPYQIKKYFNQHYPKDASTYMKLFILGDKENLDDEVGNQSAYLGISHLFAISGMHLGFIVYFFNKFLHLFYFKKQTYHYILSVFLMLYNIITGFSISIVRASIFLWILLLSKEKKYRLNASDYLSIIFIGFLLYNPYYLFALGFQLSFLMAFILIFYRPLYNHQKGIKKILTISMIAFLFSLPIVLNLDKTLGLFNGFINPIFIIYVSFILLPGAFLLIFFPMLSHYYLYTIRAFEKLMTHAMNLNVFLHFNFSNSVSKLLYWLLLSISLVFYHQYKKKIIYLWCAFILLSYLSITKFYPSKVVIFDVNQADASYIQTRDCRILIDTGNADDYDSLIHYFRGENIYALDAIILTHHHQDHYGEITDIISEIKVENVYVSKKYEDIDDSIQKVLTKGDVIQCGQTPIYVLNGDQGHANENNNSLVLYTLVGGESWLFTGDIESEIENNLIRDYNFKIDHLKVAHHGSSTSSIKAFIEHFEPKHAYVSVGKNSYGLPSKEVLVNLSEEVKRLYITKNQGSIVNVYGRFYQYRYFFLNGRKEYEIDLNI
ncbi:MAG: DNA internalization-related competence protein ComEC/Rec2 [Candidatus Izemoplasmatales bacterium]